VTVSTLYIQVEECLSGVIVSSLCWGKEVVCVGWEVSYLLLVMQDQCGSDRAKELS
jgi:hypothetical protein